VVTTVTSSSTSSPHSRDVFTIHGVVPQTVESTAEAVVACCATRCYERGCSYLRDTQRHLQCRMHNTRSIVPSCCSACYMLTTCTFCTVHKILLSVSKIEHTCLVKKNTTPTGSVCATSNHTPVSCATVHATAA
jgi:hypothetical protein